MSNEKENQELSEIKKAIKSKNKRWVARETGLSNLSKDEKLARLGSLSEKDKIEEDDQEEDNH